MEKKRAKWMTSNPLDYGLLKENARKNRKNMTEAESVFWHVVKGRVLGESCLRQHVIGDYIVDFFFRKSKLIVEIDGGYHFTKEQQEKDAIRQQWLEHQGYKILRFTNEEMLANSEEVATHLTSLLREGNDPPGLPANYPPNLPAQGGK